MKSKKTKMNKKGLTPLDMHLPNGETITVAAVLGPEAIEHLADIISEAQRNAFNDLVQEIIDELQKGSDE